MPQRPQCTRCLRPQITCICQWAKPINTSTAVTIIQHPNETKHYKGSGRLLHLCLPNSELIVGETLNIEQHINQQKQAVLLYPTNTTDDVIYPSELDTSKTQLIVIDATWRKSRKVLHLNPSLNALPKLELPHPLPSSLYDIRKAEKQGQLSTLEATALALDALEPNKALYQQLIHCFSGFVQYIQHQKNKNMD